MNINELDSFKLSDAVKFHNRLNPKIWGRDEQLLPEVREKLLAIADNFREFLGVGDLDVRDITISGSNAAYSYTPYSDIDLHLVVEFPADNEVYQELFNAKKAQYNDEHTLSIGGVPVELYVQNAAESPVSQGEYSIPREEWIQVPRRKRARIDDTCVRAKVEDIDARIHSAIESGNAESMGRLWDKIKAMRKIGLEQHGEFGCENIAFKLLRNNGCIKLLKDTGAHVIHCPASNLKLASGICRVADLQAHGVNVALGTNGSASNNALDMLAELRLAALLAKGSSNDASVVPASQALAMATLNGARALGIDNKVGSIEPGKQADLIAIDLEHPRTQPVYDPCSTLTYSAAASQISHVWVDGQALVVNHQLTRMDLAQVLEEARRWGAGIAAGA